jgi:hypothetical protein
MGPSGDRRLLSCTHDGEHVDLYLDEDSYQRWEIVPLGNGFEEGLYYIVNQGVDHQRRYLSTNGDGTNVNLWHEQFKWQTWRIEQAEGQPVGIYNIINQGVDGDRLNLSTNGDGTHADLWNEKNVYQQFKIYQKEACPMEWFELQVLHSKQCLNVRDSSTTNGAVVCQGNDPGGDNFLWRILPSETNPGWYRIQVKHSRQFLNIRDGGDHNGQTACQGDVPWGDHFLWQFTDMQLWGKDKTHLLKVKSSNQYLNIWTDIPTPWKNVDFGLSKEDHDKQEAIVYAQQYDNGQEACQGIDPCSWNYRWKLYIV